MAIRWKGTAYNLRLGAVLLWTYLRDAGYRVRFTSALRTRQQQEQLYAQRHLSRYPVAVPGTSRHERGLAFDAVIEPWPGDDQVQELADMIGVRWSPRDRVHFEVDA